MKRKFSISEVLNLLLAIALVVVLLTKNTSGNFRSFKRTSEEKDRTEVQDPKKIGALEIIYQRKSVRNFIPRKMLDKTQFTELIKAGMAAPSAKNMQPWEFIAITDTTLMNLLCERLPYAKMLKDAGGAIVVCGNLKQALEGEGQAFWVQDCSAATENILLAAEAMGLGAVWTGVYPGERVKIVSEALNIPSHVIPLCVIPVGYPTGVDKPKDKFKEEKIHWGKY